jgi:hypothetical protein
VRWSRRGLPGPVLILAIFTVQPQHVRLTHQIRLPQSLASTEQLIARCSTNDEVLRKVDAPNAVKPTDERLPTRLVDTRNHRTNEVRAEAFLIQTRAHEVRHGLGADVAFLAEAIHVDFVAEEVGHGVDVGGEAREAEEDVAVLEDLGEVVGHGEGLHAEAQVARYGYAVLADHGHAGAAVCPCY